MEMAEQHVPKQEPIPFMQTPVACVFAAIGFSCLATWWTYTVFAPVTPLLSFVPSGRGVFCVLLFYACSIAGLVVVLKRADRVFSRLRRLVIPCTLIFMVPAFAMAFLINAQVLPVNDTALYLSWMVFGLSELLLSLTWVVLFSLMSARWTALSIAVGGAFSPPLILLLLNAESPLLGLGGIAFLIGISLALAAYSLSRVDDGLLGEMGRYDHATTTKMKSRISVAVNEFAYGFIVVMICSMGLTAVLVVCALAILGSLLSILWAHRRIKSRWNLATVQRMTIPLVVAIVLLIPFLEDGGRTVCGGIALAAFACTKLMEWTEMVVMNAEFQLFPVRRFALGQITRLIGFIVGAGIALAAFIAAPLAQFELTLLCGGIVVVVVTAYAWYTGEKEEPLLDEGAQGVAAAVEGEDDEDGGSRFSTPFRDRCAALTVIHGLTSREAEIFTCLAKGRNAEYIQQTLFISNNTARTHIRHIYQKMGVTSQQQLIDLVDKVRS